MLIILLFFISFYLNEIKLKKLKVINLPKNKKRKGKN